jgi:5-formyltetrahydrofolate cyclo-ligase
VAMNQSLGRELSILKRQLRKEINTKLKQMSVEDVLGQSYVITENLKSIPLFSNINLEVKTVSIYLPIDGTPEVNTWPLIDELLSHQHRVCVPRVLGRSPEDMEMVIAPSLSELKNLPLDKWNIPQPCAEWPAIDPKEVLY